MSNIQELGRKIQSKIRQIAGDNLVDPETRRIRLTTCDDCEYLVKITNTCTKCGCFMNAKTKLKNAQCPIGKW